MEYRTKYVPNHPNASASGCVPVHVLVAEQALGHHLPKGAEVHHVDEDERNNANRNLVICQDKAYHKLLHVRARIVRAGGNPNTDKVCSFCRIAKPLDAFDVRSLCKSTGRQTACRQCRRARDVGRIRKGKAA
jgi:HNH endonuclease